MVYLDYAATSPLCESAGKAMGEFFNDRFGNPSAMYKAGVSEKVALRKARLNIADSIHASEDEIIFTSGGTESDNLAIFGALDALNVTSGHIITTMIEHPAVYETVKALEKRNFRTTFLPVNEDGLVSLDDVIKEIKDDTLLVSVMYANNETGVIQPISQIGKICREKHILFHVDAVQAIGHENIDIDELSCDLLSASAHKFGGPKGAGFLYVRKGTKLTNVLFGGSQQQKLRPGTENTMGIAGMSAAVTESLENMDKNVSLSVLRDYFEEKVLEEISNAHVNGKNTKRLPGHSNISFKGIEGEALLILLDSEGICASSGSACSLVDGKPSRSLMAMGLSEDEARGSIRFSLGISTTKEELDYTVSVLQKSIKYLRDIRV